MKPCSYKIVRSKRKTIALTVTREGEILVRAPISVSGEYLDGFVARHAEWIAKRLRAVAARSRLDLSDGAQLELFGTRYSIAAGGRARIVNGTLFLPAEGREQALASFLKRFSREVMAVMTERLARAYGFRYASVRISSARGRWGSCNAKGVIAYSFRVAFLPPPLLEYVVIHELSHTVVFNHSPAFWQVVEGAIPDWKRRRKALKVSNAMDFL